jgi:hypothetical protein
LTNSESKTNWKLFFREEIFLIRWFDHLIYVIKFYLITSLFNFLYMNNSITNCICLFKTIRIVNFFINMLIFNRVVLQSLSRNDLFKSRWFFSYLLIFEMSRNQRTWKSICDSDKIRSKWQRSSKTSWSKEQSLVTIEDLDIQKNLDKSWDEKLVNNIVKREFLYNEMIFSSKKR